VCTRYSKKSGQPVNENTGGAVACFEDCLGEGEYFEVTITGAKEGGHGTGSAHETGEACDIGKNSNPTLDRKNVGQCYEKCFSQSSSYAQEEANHFHFQTRPGKGGTTGFAPGIK
jgi:hypothetical protein